MKHLTKYTQEDMKSISEFNKIVKNYMTMIRILTASIIILFSFNCFSQYQYLGSGSSTTKLLLHLNDNSLDASGNGNNGIDSLITYGLAYGKFSQGASFNGTSSKITIPNKFTSLNRTYSLWFKLGSQTTAGFILCSRTGTTDQGIDILINTSNVHGFLNSRIRTDSSINLSDTIAYNLNDNNWHNIIFVINNTTKLFSTYVDGNFKHSKSYTGTITDSQNLQIGNRSNASYFNGYLDEFFIENRALTSSEIKRYYTFSKGFYTNN